MNDTVIRQAGAYKLTPEAYLEFEELLVDWVDANRGEIECGGTGHHRVLARLCSAWADKHIAKAD